jgi:hypothetical protein
MFAGDTTFFLLILGVQCTPIGLAASYWKYHLITSAFLHGTEVRGRVIQ